MRRGFLCLAAVAVLLLTACGSSGGSSTTTTQQGKRLTQALYRAQVAIFKREATKAQSDVAQGLQAKTVAELKQRIDKFAAETQRLGDKIAALNPPKDAEAANTQLAQGLHDISAGTRDVSSQIANLKSVGTAIAYIEHAKRPKKGGLEVQKAIAKLQKLGYTTDTG